MLTGCFDPAHLIWLNRFADALLSGFGVAAFMSLLFQVTSGKLLAMAHHSGYS